MITPTSLVGPALLDATGLPIVVSAGKCGENLRESDKSEEQIHSPKCGGSHLV